MQNALHLFNVDSLSTFHVPDIVLGATIALLFPLGDQQLTEAEADLSQMSTGGQVPVFISYMHVSFYQTATLRGRYYFFYYF